MARIKGNQIRAICVIRGQKQSVAALPPHVFGLFRAPLHPLRREAGFLTMAPSMRSKEE
jgi:hypothetical protein